MGSLKVVWPWNVVGVLRLSKPQVVEEGISGLLRSEGVVVLPQENCLIQDVCRSNSDAF